MCGRVAIVDLGQIFAEFSITGIIPSLDDPPRFNVGPTTRIPVIRAGAQGTRHLELVRWGLIPRWAKDPTIGSRLINARVESVSEKPAFREAFRSRRCVVAASGFFEWSQSEKPKQPYYVTRQDQRPMPMAGLWECWTSPDGELVESCAIITKPAEAPVSELHDRMPAILNPDGVAAWLDPSGARSTEALRALLLETSLPLALVPVSNRVNSVMNDGPECIAPVELGVQRAKQGTLPLPFDFTRGRDEGR